MADKIKILFLASNPTDITRIRIDEELREIDERMSIGRNRDSFELIPHFAVRPRDLRRGLERHEPHILHFSGHGSTSAGIVLEDNEGKTKLVAAADLAELLSIIKDNLRVVFLNSCYSGLQASGITKSIDCAIGMNDKVGDRTAVLFAATFYENLAFGRSIEDSFKISVTELKLEGDAGASIPTLISKEGAELSKVYLGQKPKLPQPRKRPAGVQKPNQKINIGDGTSISTKDGNVSIGNNWSHS